MTKKEILFTFLAVILALWANDTIAGEFKAGNLTVSSPWARSTPAKARNGAVYMTIKNGGAATDRLMAVKTPVAGHAGLHQTVMEQDVMRMRPVKAMQVPPGGMAMLKPGGYHIMLMGLKTPLKEGHSFPLTLTFDKAGEITIMVPVMKSGDKENTGDKSHHHH